MKDELILNLNRKGNYVHEVFRSNILLIRLDDPVPDDHILITFSAPVKDVVFESYCKDQLIYKIIKDE